jgi:hypothetical protein
MDQWITSARKGDRIGGSAIAENCEILFTPSPLLTGWSCPDEPDQKHQYYGRSITEISAETKQTKAGQKYRCQPEEAAGRCGKEKPKKVESSSYGRRVVKKSKGIISLPVMNAGPFARQLDGRVTTSACSKTISASRTHRQIPRRVPLIFLREGEASQGRHQLLARESLSLRERRLQPHHRERTGSESGERRVFSRRGAESVRSRFSIRSAFEIARWWVLRVPAAPTSIWTA